MSFSPPKTKGFTDVDNKKTEQLSLFKNILISLNKQKLPKELVNNFVKVPNLEVLGKKSNKLSCSIYENMVQYTSVEDREKIFEDLKKSGLFN